MEDSVDYSESLISLSLNNKIQESVQENGGAEKQRHSAEQTGQESSGQDEKRDGEPEANEAAKPKGIPFLPVTLPDDGPGTEEATFLISIVRD